MTLVILFIPFQVCKTNQYALNVLRKQISLLFITFNTLRKCTFLFVPPTYLMRILRNLQTSEKLFNIYRNQGGYSKNIHGQNGKSFAIVDRWAVLQNKTDNVRIFTCTVSPYLSIDSATKSFDWSGLNWRKLFVARGKIKLNLGRLNIYFPLRLALKCRKMIKLYKE